MTTPPIDILLVDDEPRNLDTLEAILADQGYRFVRAQDADSALRRLLENDVAAIVLDIQMPDVNGLELARLIKGTKRYRQVPILFLTAHRVEEADILTGYDAGAVDYLTKPFNPQILRQKLAVFTDLFRKTRALADLNEKLEQRVAERTAELERSEQALRETGRLKDEFLATLAHELRNPLAPLRTGVDLLLQAQTASPAVVGRTLSAMDRQLNHLVRLIDDLLDLSRINTGVLKLKRERTDLATLVRGIVDTFRALLERRRIELVVRTQPSLWVDVDPTRIAQLLGNLLHNASKFTPEGGTVRVDVERQSGRATVRVIDSGRGIPQDQLERVFEMFTRIERTGAPEDRGAGIGLALARRLAQMHGGDLTAFSLGEGFGATFVLDVPALNDVQPPPEVVAAPVRNEVGRALDVLVIEDSEDVAFVLVDALEMFGHRVSVARNGTEGVRLAQVARPGLILCDVGLPGMDGLEVCRHVRALSLEVRPVMVALTGWGMEKDRRRTRDAGFDYHLVKPIGIDALSEVLAKAADALPPDEDVAPRSVGAD